MADEQLICIIPTIKKRINAYVDRERPLTKLWTLKSVGRDIGGLHMWKPKRAETHRFYMIC